MNFAFCTQQDHIGRESIVPKAGSKEAAGYDLYSFEDTIIPPNSTKKVSIGIKIAISPGFYGKICDRSSLAIGRVTTSAGIIDSDYRGVICVVINNNSDSNYHVNFGDRIAQIIFQRYESPNLEKMSESQFEKYFTERGSGGFGSTGK